MQSTHQLYKNALYGGSVIHNGSSSGSSSFLSHS